MKILITNDDGYDAKGIKVLVNILKKYGQVTIVAPKSAQSGMSMAVSMGYRPLAVKKLYDKENESWWYLDGTPASCVKYGIDNVMAPELPDVVISGINHGSNAATASIYSGTVGAAMEGAVNGITSIAVSLDSFDPDADFSVVEDLFPAVFEKIVAMHKRKFGSFYNVNFPALPSSEVKGVRVCNMAMVHWEREYRDFYEHIASVGRSPRPEDEEYIRNLEPGEEIVVMAGDLTENEGNLPTSDHVLLRQGYVTITPENIDNTDYAVIERLKTEFE